MCVNHITKKMFKQFIFLKRGLLLITLFFAIPALADYPVAFEGSLYGGVGSNDFAPFYMNSNNGGRVTQSKNLLLDLSASHKMDTTRRFSYSWGIEALAGLSNKVAYARYNADSGTWGVSDQRPPAVWIQQLYAQVKWRSLYLQAGMKEEESMIVDPLLSSGDICVSKNARPIAAVRAGFIDYQNIPLTKGWVQIRGCISFGRFTDDKWKHTHFNQWTGHYTDRLLWAYKNIYFRTKPTKPFFVTVGMQNPGLWGGTTFYYNGGKLTKKSYNKQNAGAFFSMLIPHENTKDKEGHYMGDQKGSWDLKATYRFRDNSTLSAYFQWFWEDGSAMAKRNGMDGLWGIHYNRPGRHILNGALFEYFDFTNMSGPLHYALQEHPNSIINVAAGGYDGYYNNAFYGSYANYGMTIGNSLVMGPLFYRDCSLEISGFRTRAFHFGLNGSIGSQVDWLVKFNYRTSYGKTNTLQLIYPKYCTSFLAQADWQIARVPGLSLTAQFALDHGSLPQNTCAGAVTVTYHTTLFSKKN